jgi:D-3-phosphoglycerate dehydrogenase
MKAGSMLINCARGGIVDEPALLAALENKHLGGAALDVFAEEPPTDTRLVSHPRVVATPHIGAQTREAQERVATETAKMVLAALDGSLAVTAVNLPFMSIGGTGEAFLALGEQLGRLASSLLAGSLLEVRVELWGVDDELRVPTTVAAVKGSLMPFLGEAVNIVNAETVAAGRGVEVVRSIHHQSGEYPHLVEVRLRGESGEVAIAGTVFGDRDPRVVRFEGYRLEFRPKGFLLLVRNRDVPGVVGKVGTLLGDADVNIAEIHLARSQEDSEAMAVVRLDGKLEAPTLDRLSRIPEVTEVQMIDLSGG